MEFVNTWFAIVVGTIAFLSLTVSIILIFVDSTCKMAKPLSNFSAAISEATTVTTSALSFVQAVDHDEAVLRAARGMSLKENDFPEFLSLDDLLRRQLVLQALATYAASLETLSGVDRSADIHKSVESLKTAIDSTVTSINKLNTQPTRQLSSGLASDLLSLGSNLAIAFASGGRDRAIRTTLEENDKAVTKICSLFAAELEPHGVIYDEIENDYRRKEEAADYSFRAMAKPRLYATPDPDLSAHAKAFLEAKNQKEYLLALLNSLASSYRRIGQAHTALKVQSENGTKSDVQLKALSSEVDKLRFLSSKVSK
jgi:hypothetical protein